MRWLFHLVRPVDLGWGSDGRYAPPSLASEGFIHASYKDAVAESASLYFKAEERDSLRVLAIDPRRVDVPIDVAATPRGPMPHLRGSLPVDAVRVLGLEDLDAHPDRVRGTRIVLLAFDGMTLLDLVGPLDALSRIASMHFDDSTVCEVAALSRALRPDEQLGDPPIVWSAWGAELVAARYRPPLDAFDVLVVPGGPGTRVLEKDEAAMAYLATFPENRLTASVCTGSLLLGAAGRLRGKRATTHATMRQELARFGATPVDARVVDDGQLVTSGGVTSGIDLGLHLVRRLAGDAAHAKIAAQMEVVLGPVALVLLLVWLGLGLGGCGRAPVQREPLREAGAPVAPGDALAAFDALTPGASESPLYPPRVATRLGLAAAVARDRLVALPAGLWLRVAWETRDDLVFAERDLTLVKVTVDHLAPGVSCVINRASKAAWPPAAGSLDSVRVDLSIDYACAEGSNTTTLALAIGTVSADGFTRLGPATGTPEAAPVDTTAPPAVTAVHFAPKSAALDAAATAALEGFAKVLQADEALALCLAIQAETTPPELQKRRLEAVRKALVERGVARARVALEVGTGQAPPAVDDLELWPHDLVCKAPRVRRRR